VKSLLFLIASAALAFAQAPPAKKAAAPPAKTGAPAAKTGAAPAKSASSGSSRLLNPAAFKATAPPVYRAKFTTTKGDFVVEVTREWAPIGADRFYNLVRGGFFTNAAFFRVLPGFVVQFGMNANPAVQQAWEKANLKDEPVKHSNTKGTLTFAKSQLPNSRTTQLFINLGNNTQLDSDGFSAFGAVTEGMDVVGSLYSGYGESASNQQDKISQEGKAFLDRNYPKLDSIKSATIIFPEPAAAPAKKAAAPAAKKEAPAAPPKK
jgi:peptidyl-prolyl cis-trans isomerase A (cyclophilin A)